MDKELYTRLVTMQECIAWSDVIARAALVLDVPGHHALSRELGDIGADLSGMVDADSPVVEATREEEQYEEENV